MIRDTSMQAYEDIKDQLNELEAKVYEAIIALTIRLDRGPTDREIRAWLNANDKEKSWEISDVTGRRNGLMSKNIVRASQKIKQNNRQVYTWRITYEPFTVDRNGQSTLFQ